MTMFFYPTRVNARTKAKAREKIVAEMTAKGLQPKEEPKPFKAFTQYGQGGPLWECYCMCEAVSA